MLVPNRGGSKKFYTRKDDETVIALAKEGKSTKEIAAALGRSEASVQYRINRVLNHPKVKTLDDIKYKGAGAAAVEVAEEEVVVADDSDES